MCSSDLEQVPNLVVSRKRFVKILAPRMVTEFLRPRESVSRHPSSALYVKSQSNANAMQRIEKRLR